ncbi:MAG TPA: AAA family ATPase [Gammaproteobacteria bacterium]
MYARHFGLERRLFAGIAHDEAVFIGDAQRTAAEYMRIGLGAPDSVVVLHGPPGVGKTTLAANALRSSSPSTRVASAWLAAPPSNPYDLLELLLAEFGFEPYKHSRVERLQTWRQFLTELGATDTRIFIGVERADEVGDAVLRALDSLTAADANGCPGANVILMGEDALLEHLRLPALTGLRQRVRLVRRVEPLEADDVEAYLACAASAAGVRLDALLATDALAELARRSRGIPRVLNNLCETALALAAARGEPVATADLVLRAAVDLQAAPDGPSAETDTRSADATNMPFAEAADLPFAETPDAPFAEAADTPFAEAADPSRATERADNDGIPVLTEFVDIGEPAAAEWDAADAEPWDAPDAELWETPARTAERGTPVRAVQREAARAPSAATRAAAAWAGAAVGEPEFDPAATLTLLEDHELDALSAEVAAAILSPDGSDWPEPAELADVRS